MTACLAKEVAAIARIGLPGPHDRYCSALYVPSPGVSESRDAVVAWLLTVRRTPRRELIRIKGEFLDAPSDRLVFGDLLRREIEPFIEGVGQVRVAWDESLRALVVLAAAPHDDLN